MFQGLNALSWAVLGNKHKAVDLLIKQGLDIESTDLQLRTPLHHASSSSDSRLVITLGLQAEINFLNVKFSTGLLQCFFRTTPMLRQMTKTESGQ